MTFVSYAQNFEDVTLWRALKDCEPGFYIDVGAWDADFHSVTRAFSQRGWRGINVEPVPHLLAQIAGRRPRDVNVCVAVGERSGVIDFFEVAGSGLSTTDAGAAAGYAADGWTVERRDIEVQTLASLCREHAPATIHFLKIDCEGDEAAVLRGADFVAYRPWIVLLEATEPQSETPNHAAFEPLLLGQGYVFAWFDGLNRFYVAEEEASRLVPLLARPPSVFDGFVRAMDVLPWPPAVAASVALPQGPGCRAPVLSAEDRIGLAARCRDCDGVPKVADAGRVRQEPDGTAVQIMHNGLKVVADGYAGAWMTRLITACAGHHEPQEESVFHAVVQVAPPDAAMIELGGAWSYYSAWFLQGAPGRRAVVLEPDPANRANGERTMALNGLQAAFIAGSAGRSPHAGAPFETERSGALILPCYSVPQIMQEQGIERLHLLHCDTQGAELEVLEGCRTLFTDGRVDFVFVSTHVHLIAGDPIIHDRCLQLLRSCGAVIEAEHDCYESFSGDGLIVARFGPAAEGWVAPPISRARSNEGLFRHPSYDLADAFALLDAVLGPGRGAPAVPPPPLAEQLAGRGRIVPIVNSHIGVLYPIGGCEVLEGDGTQLGFLCHGPYCAAEAGQYECTFLLRVDRVDAVPEDPILLFDIAYDRAARPGRHPVRYADLVPGEFVLRQFSFHLAHAVESLEMRLELCSLVPVAMVAAIALRRVE